MSLQQRTTGTFGFRQGLLARPPMPDDALAYADFCAGLHMSQTAESVSAGASLVFGPVSSIKPGYYYGRDNIEFMSGTLWDRVEYGPDGECLGLLVEGSYQNRVLPGQRQALTAGTAVGAVISASGAAAQPWQQWYSLAPSGAGEASLTLDTSAVATAGAWLYGAVDVRGGSFVQVGTAGTGYVNVDTRSGEVRAFDGASGRAIPRPGNSWTVSCRGIVPAGGLENAGLYVASVASLDAPKRGPAGAAFEVRAPRLDAATVAGLPRLGLWPHTSSDSHAADSLTPNITGLADTDDFTAIMRVRSGPSASMTDAGLWLFTNANGSAGTELRFSSSNTLVLVDRRPSTVRWTSSQRYAPSRIYRMGISRSGGRLAIAVNGEAVSLDAGAAAGLMSRPLRGFDQSANQWAGHLQKTIWWAGGRSQAELIMLTDRWL